MFPVLLGKINHTRDENKKSIIIEEAKFILMHGHFSGKQCVKGPFINISF